MQARIEPQTSTRTVSVGSVGSSVSGTTLRTMAAASSSPTRISVGSGQRRTVIDIRAFVRRITLAVAVGSALDVVGEQRRGIAIVRRIGDALERNERDSLRIRRVRQRRVCRGHARRRAAEAGADARSRRLCQRARVERR